MALPVDIDSISLTQQLSSPPKASLQILGTHSVNQDNNFIDFDIWVDCTKIYGIESAKFLTDREVESRSWSYSADHDNGDPKVILGGWLDDWLNYNNTDDRSWALWKSGHFPDEDCTALEGHLERLARKTAYGGTVEVLFHTPSTEFEAGKNASNENTNIANIYVHWTFECPFTPIDQVWSELVMNAMVDHKKGWIEPHLPKPSHGMSPFRRAMRANGTSRIVSQEQDSNEVTRSVRQFSSWGCDASV
ncbi:hypothetical protein CBS115989_7862 [Aspergillus niger]|uniref:Uncharacterized protein n=3 Tax=Aspergillus niger TaxID=5061 RepID=G3Y176_ASPNA|nr:hypothetical protein ANI_1_2160024 [Aspergillus niger CBS 513.88]EHA22580.1 hypothetical protein ASPNIDRAFT_36623 [Aspergillus niger ATCC 1015]KAI2815175.1 hypothetical protein CBS115989_7862 [Aspergillus niger]RDH24978.1 hypothetical protein M747DRAFT_291817 [Aspergillus niger ATCC 13496]KAI2827352.1 hypothetical protein CBS133816_6624 [Aspergillus niger]KAI2859467.1 hypothetical protein CBS11232_1928 [Aspergillus niger]|eukprot:XP_001399188.2 hypothetical protein ANI_1_2160024 [Aspergillus niger CBS 513.88]